MRKLFLGFSYLTAQLLASTAHAQEPLSHYLGVGVGQTDIVWEEFLVGVSEELYQALEEDGSIDELSLTYAVKQGHESLAVTYSQANGTVDYFGLPVAVENATWRRTTTDYSIENLEFEYGGHFDVDYIKPYGAVLGGYHRRQRSINNSEGFSGLRDETYRYYYWGVLLEAEIFSWKGVSLDMGGRYSRSLKPKIDAKAFAVNPDGSLAANGQADFDLEALVTTGGHIKINYSFMHRWKASLAFEYSEMDKDLTEDAPKVGSITDHPAVEQTLQSLKLTLLYRIN